MLGLMKLIGECERMVLAVLRVIKLKVESIDSMNPDKEPHSLLFYKWGLLVI